MKKVISLILAILFIFVSLPFVPLTVMADATQNVLYFESKDDGPLMTRVSVVPGAEYMFAFSASNSISNFNLKGFDNDSHSVIDISAEEDDFFSVDGKYNRYVYIITIPETLKTEDGSDKGFMFIGFTFPANTSGYIFDMVLVDEDDNDILSNGKFTDGLNHWAWDWDAWFESWKTGLGLSEWSNDNVSLKVVKYDDMLFKKMIHITNDGSSEARLAKAVTLTKNHTYQVSFKYNLVEGSIGSSIRFNLAFLNSSGKLSGQLIGDAFEDWDGRYVAASINEDTCTVTYTFKLKDHEWNNFTYEEVDDYGVGFMFKSGAEPTDIYIGDFKIVDTENPTVNLFGDSDYVGSLSGWHSEWDVATGASFKQAGYKATLLNYDINKFTLQPQEMVEPAAPAKMVYYKNASSEVLGNRFTAEAGKNYYLSFGIASTTDTSAIEINAYGDGNRTKINVAPQLISSVKHETYTWLTYSITMPENLSSVASYNMVYIGPKIPANSDTYVFNMNIYNPYAKEKTNLFTNKSFETLRYLSIGEWTLIVPSYAYENGTGNKLSVDTTEWYNNAQTKILKSVDYNEALFAGLKKMLYFNFSAKKDLYTRISVTANQSYDLEFSLSRNVQESDFSIIVKKDESRDNISATKTLISKTNHEKYVTYKYRIVLPSSVPSMAFFGINFAANTKGYLFDVKLSKTDDATSKQLLSNGNFGSGLDKWACDWDAWFESWGVGTGKTSWSNSSAELVVMNYDNEAFSELLVKTMLHYYGKVSGDDKAYLAQKVTLTKGHTYSIEFLYGAVSGGFDDTCYLTLNKYNASSRPDVPLFGDPKLEDEYQFIKTVDKEKHTVKYTFTLEGDRVSSLAETATYALVLASYDKNNYTDIYISDFVMYDTEDLNKANLLSMDNYTTSVGGWASYWDNASSGAASFTQQGYTVRFETFDASKFAYEKQMLYFKETKKNGFEVFLQKIGTLEADVEYTVSMDYYFKSGNLNETMYFGIFGGPGEGDAVYKKQYRASMENNLSVMFDTEVDTGKNLTYTFTLTQDEASANADFYAGFYLLPDPDMVTELYLYNLSIYKTEDANKKNICLDNEYATTIRNWYSHYGKSVGNSTEFTRPDVEYVAKYVPLIEEYFEFPELDVHNGDANADGLFNINDLIALKKRILAAEAYFVMSDINNDSSVDGEDLIITKKILLGLEEKNWEESTIKLETFNKSGGSDAEAEILKNTILNATDSVSATRTYYVSNDGDDNNDGRSPETPIKTISKVNKLSLRSGDAVLFRRGDTFRTDTKITVNNGVIYSAYGTGAKPKIYGSIKNYADKNIWSSTDGNIWVTSISSSFAENVVFNDGESVGTRKRNLENLRENGDFYFDSNAGKLYLFLNQFNPGAAFDSIEISSADYIFYGVGSDRSEYYYIKNITISNLDLRYAGIHAMYLAFVQNININNCSIGWMGGKYLSETNNTRYGNGIELWRIAKNCSITNNYIYQVFDAAITFQGTETNQYTDLTITNNLIEYCSMNFEFWAKDSSGSIDPTAKLQNIYFNNNILRFGGYGYGGAQREAKLDQAYILTWNANYSNNQISNFQIKNNIFDIANSNYFYAKNTIDALTISDNTYYQMDGSAFQIANGYGDYATDEADFATAIGKLDSNPTLVQWIS